jgi:hypothetical protein
VTRADDLQAAYEQEKLLPWHECSAIYDAAVAAIPDLLAVVRAAHKHSEDCCRTDLDWKTFMSSHDALVSALAAFEAGAA